MSSDAWIFDFDNHYYESTDAFTRHQDRSLGNRGVRWAEIDGTRRLLVGGTVNSYIANPTFDPVAKPGSLYDWYRGNPHQYAGRIFAAPYIALLDADCAASPATLDLLGVSSVESIRQRAAAACSCSAGTTSPKSRSSTGCRVGLRPWRG